MSNQLGTIAILGSGETSPNLVAVHRKLLQEIPEPVNAYMLDSPFGFQENAKIAISWLNRGRTNPNNSKGFPCQRQVLKI